MQIKETEKKGKVERVMNEIDGGSDYRLYGGTRVKALEPKGCRNSKVFSLFAHSLALGFALLARQTWLNYADLYPGLLGCISPRCLMNSRQECESRNRIASPLLLKIPSPFRCLASEWTRRAFTRFTNRLQVTSSRKSHTWLPIRCSSAQSKKAGIRHSAVDQ